MPTPPSKVSFPPRPIKQVVAGAAVQRVVAGIPDQRVAEGGADDILDPGQRVRPAPTSRLRAGCPEIDAHGCGRVGIRRAIAADAADQRIVAVPAGKQVIAGGAVEPVVAPEPTKRIVAAASIEVILPAVPVRLSSLSPPAKSEATDSVPSANCSVSTPFTWFTDADVRV